jgi:hypothetical protein
MNEKCNDRYTSSTTKCTRIHQLEHNFRAKMLRFKGYISNFTCASYYFLYVEFGDFYVNQFLAGQTIPVKLIEYLLYLYS